MFTGRSCAAASRCRSAALRCRTFRRNRSRRPKRSCARRSHRCRCSSAAKDGLLAAAEALNVLRPRSPAHGEELIRWTDRFMASSGLDETAEEKRLRHAACLLADIGWRAHPDYRGEQSLNIIANAAFVE